LRNSPLKESLYCIRCGACLNACPVFRELSGHAYIGSDLSIAPYPGPIGSVISPGLLGENYVQLAQASSLCGACKEVCPVDIDLPKLLTRVRAGVATNHQSSSNQLSVDNGGAGLSPSTRLGLRLFTRAATRPRLFAVSQKFASLGTFLLSPFSRWVRLPAFTGWGLSKDFPRFAGKTFRERFVAKEVVESEVPRLRHEVVATSGDVALQFDFTSELTALGGNVHQTKNAAQDIIEFLKTREINKIHLEPNTLDEDLLRAAKIEFTDSPDPQITVGVTNAICGLADTGSVLIVDGTGDPLKASLLPEIHIAVLKSSDILPSLPDAMGLVKNKNTVFITGPSRTADIEMTLTIGVHGPKEIHVFLT
jgi:L-lactate dehydrogenase complex protein LldF